MYVEPSSYWDNFRRRMEIERMERDWLLQLTAFGIWLSFLAAGAGCVSGLWSMAFS